MLRSAKLLLFVVASSSLTFVGCKRDPVPAVTNPSDYHRLTNRVGGKADAHAITYDSRGRGAYLKVETQAAASLIKLCAEPPPDVSANLDTKSDLSVQVKALAEYELLKASVDTNVKRSQAASSTIADAATRTELVLFMRDALYRICEMQFNGTMDPSQAREAFTNLIAAGRVLGQRDNVGKLIELAGILMNSKEPDAALVHDVIGTIRFLAASDYLLANVGGKADSDIVARLLISEVLGSNNIAEARRLLELRMKDRKLEFEKLNQKIAKLESEIATLNKGAAKDAKKAEVKLIKSEREEIRVEQMEDVDYYKGAFSVAPPSAVLINGPVDAGAQIE